MNKWIITAAVIVLLVFFIFIDDETDNQKPLVETYPWQINNLPDGRSSVFGIVLGETLIKDIAASFNSEPKIALFETKNKLSLEAYYKSVSLGGMIGSFIFTLEADDKNLNLIKNESSKKKRAENNSLRYELDKPASDKLKMSVVNNLIYIPTVQLDEEIIIQRFGQPKYKIKLKSKEIGWHYLYPDKGLDLIYMEDGKEVLQYVQLKNFNALLEPLQIH